MTQQSKVREMLDAVFHEGEAYQLPSLKEFRDVQFMDVAAAEQALYDAMLAIVGKDEVKRSVVETYQPLGRFGGTKARTVKRFVDGAFERNKLRAEQRKALNALFGKKGETE